MSSRTSNASPLSHGKHYVAAACCAEASESNTWQQVLYSVVSLRLVWFGRQRLGEFVYYPSFATRFSPCQPLLYGTSSALCEVHIDASSKEACPHFRGFGVGAVLGLLFTIVLDKIACFSLPPSPPPRNAPPAAKERNTCSCLPNDS